MKRLDYIQNDTRCNSLKALNYVFQLSTTIEEQIATHFKLSKWIICVSKINDFILISKYFSDLALNPLTAPN
jgi:hypothetical protein